MSVIVEFGVPDDQFLPGRVLAPPSGMHVGLERVVPTGSTGTPFVWVRGDAFERLERHARESDAVRSFTALDRLDDWALDRVEWADGPESRLDGIDPSTSVPCTHCRVRDRAHPWPVTVVAFERHRSGNRTQSCDRLCKRVRILL